MIGANFRRPPGAPKTLALASLVALAVVTPGLHAQASIDREINFVRALAREMRLISLAQGELERLQQSFRSAGDQDRIAQLKVEFALYAARSSGDRTQQRTDYKKALDNSKELLERASDADVQRDSRRTLAEAAQEFGQFLIEELEIAREEDPDRVEELEEEAGATFRLGIEACDSVMQELEADKHKTPQHLLEYCLVWRRKGALLRENARAVKDDRGHLIDSAMLEIEEMVLEIGEENALGLRGLFELAMCYEVADSPKDAIDGYQSTIKQILYTLNKAQEGEIDLPAETGALLYDMMQEVYAYLGDMLFERGDVEAANKLFAEFRENIAKFGQTAGDLLDLCDPRFGHLTFLAECRLLADSGQPDKVKQALATAQIINEKHPRDYVGIKAKSVLREILKAQEELVSGTLLFEVAKGEYQNGNYEEAIKGFRRAVASMSAQEQDELALEAYDWLGKSYRNTDRWLESTLAMQHGLQKFGQKQDGTEHDKAGEIADSLDRMVTWLKSLTKSDPALTPVYSMCEPLVLKYSEAGVGKIHWKNGNDLFQSGKYVEAAKAYSQVPVDFLHYELAQARQAKALEAVGQFEQALAVTSAYRQWLQTKDAVLDPKRTDKAQVRELAIRESDFAEARIDFISAYGSMKFNIEKDTSKYPPALAKMRAFIANYSEQGDLNVLKALDALGRMHADLGELDQAEEAYTRIKNKDQTRASRLATVIFAVYLDHAENLTKELDAAITGGKDQATIDNVSAELRAARASLCSLGTDYMRSAPKPQLGILVNTMNLFELLGDWKKVDEVAKKTLALYGEDAASANIIDLSVRPKIGQALLEQGKFDQALTMLQAAEQANPQQFELKRLICRALGGWFYINNSGRGIRQVALGRPKDAYDKYVTEYKQWALRPGNDKYSLPWYRYHWESYWFAKQAGLEDDDYAEYARKIYRSTIQIDNGAGLRAIGADGTALFRFFELNPPPR